MTWVWFIAGTWLVAGIAVAVLIGRSIHLASIKAEHSEPDDYPVSAVVPLPPAPPTIEGRGPAARRQNSSPTAAPRSPLISGCVSPAARIPSEHEHGVL
jgi:hypothetical protein